jgi:hypothetical protein
MAHTSLNFFFIFAVLLWSDAAYSQRWEGAPQTVPFADQGSGIGWTPRPTASPKLLLRRQNGPHSVCGYVDGDVGMFSPTELNLQSIVI